MLNLCCLLPLLLIASLLPGCLQSSKMKDVQTSLGDRQLLNDSTNPDKIAGITAFQNKDYDRPAS